MKVRAMTRVATPENEDVSFNSARYGTASHVGKQVCYYRKWKRNEKLEQNKVRFMQRRVNLYQNDDDTWVLRGRLTAERRTAQKGARSWRRATVPGTARPFRENGLQIDDETAVPELYDMHMDYDLTVFALIQRE